MEDPEGVHLNLPPPPPPPPVFKYPMKINYFGLHLHGIFKKIEIKSANRIPHLYDSSYLDGRCLMLWLFVGPIGVLAVGFLLLRYSVLFTVQQSLFLLYLLAIS